MKPVKLEGIPKTNRWKVLEDYVYVTNAGDYIKVKEGFDTDLASIPRPFWPIIGHPAGRYRESAVVHDNTYRYLKFSRLRCDKIFYECLKKQKITLWRRKAMYRFVRSFGWRPYNKYKKINKKGGN